MGKARPIEVTDALVGHFDDSSHEEVLKQYMKVEGEDEDIYGGDILSKIMG